MSFIPSSVLSKLYNRTSLRNAENAVQFSVKNRLSPATLRKVTRFELDGQPIDLDRVAISPEGGAPTPVLKLTAKKPLDFPLGTLLTFSLEIAPLEEGRASTDRGVRHPALRRAETGGQRLAQYGQHVRRARCRAMPVTTTVTRSSRPDSNSSANSTGAQLDHVSRYSIDPRVTRGQYRAFHRRDPGSAGVCRALAGPRPARTGRVLCAAGDQRGHAGRFLQPRHEGAASQRRREVRCGGRQHAAGAGVRLRRRGQCRAFQRLDRRAQGEHQDRRRRHRSLRRSWITSTPTCRTLSLSCASTSRPAMPPA